MNELTEEKAIATVIRHTKKRRTVIRPLEVAEALKFLYEQYGSKAVVARKTSISDDMVWQFLELNDLPGEIKSMIKEGLITGIDLPYWISRLDSDLEKIKLAKLVSAKNLTSSDVRSVVDLRRKQPNLPILDCVQKVLESKPKKTNVYEIITLVSQETLEKLEERAKSLEINRKELASKILIESIGLESIESLRIENNGVIVIELTEDNYQKLDKSKEAMNFTSEQFIDSIFGNWLDK